jgi:dihydropteroate synthase
MQVRELIDTIKERKDLGGKSVLIMGVLNRTPDSFSDGGRFLDDDIALGQCRNMVKSGADIIDIGGESTRPGASQVSAEEEIERILPIIKAVKDNIDVPISVDTYKPEVAREALAAGAEIVNDITALSRGGREMAELIKESGAYLILMHMKGSPADMQINPVYDDLISEIIGFLAKASESAENSGIPSDKIIVDPGIGFGKTTEHNLEIIDRLNEFRVLNKPIAVGASRKSFIGNVLGKKVDCRVVGSVVSAALAVYNGARIVRVHDVDETAQAVLMARAIKNRRRDSR